MRTRVYEGTNTYPDGTDICFATKEKKIRECAMACTSQNPPNAKNLNKKITPLSFLLSIDNGRCYCSSQSAIVQKR